MAKKKEEKEEKEKKEEKKEIKEEKEEEKETPSADERFANLEKKLGEQGNYLGQIQPFIDGASAVINTIAGSPELTKAFRKELKEKYPELGGKELGEEGEESKEKKVTPPPSDEIKATVDDVAASQRHKIIQDFESRYGIDKMKEEEQKTVRGKVAGFFADFGWKITTMPLKTLGSNLERAYIATHAEKLREEGKLEGLTKARETELGTMKTISGGGVPPAGEEELTEKQKEWGKKLGAKEEDMVKRYKARDEEATRPSAAETKKEEKE